jgi:hypothetical protein
MLAGHRAAADSSSITHSVCHVTKAENGFGFFLTAEMTCGGYETSDGNSSAAESAGFPLGRRILSVNGHAVRSTREVVALMQQFSIGDRVAFALQPLEPEPEPEPEPDTYTDREIRAAFDRFDTDSNDHLDARELRAGEMQSAGHASALCTIRFVCLSPPSDAAALAFAGYLKGYRAKWRESQLKVLATSLEGSLERQQQALSAYYSIHQPTKPPADIVSILEHRRFAGTPRERAGLSRHDWSQLSLQLEAKYGEPLDPQCSVAPVSVTAAAQAAANPDQYPRALWPVTQRADLGELDMGWPTLTTRERA